MTSEKENTVIRPYVVMFYDPWKFRHEQFVVSCSGDVATKVYPQIFHAHDSLEFMRALNRVEAGQELPWDVLFFPTYSDVKTERDEERRVMNRMCNRLCTLDEEKQPRLIVFHGHTDEYGVLEAFRIAKLPVVHQPFTDRTIRSS